MNSGLKHNHKIICAQKISQLGKTQNFLPLKYIPPSIVPKREKMSVGSSCQTVNVSST